MNAWMNMAVNGRVYKSNILMSEFAFGCFTFCAQLLPVSNLKSEYLASEVFGNFPDATTNTHHSLKPTVIKSGPVLAHPNNTFAQNEFHGEKVGAFAWHSRQSAPPRPDISSVCIQSHTENFYYSNRLTLWFLFLYRCILF